MAQTAIRRDDDAQQALSATRSSDGFVRFSRLRMALLDAEGRLLAMSATWLLDGVEPAIARRKA